MKEDSHKEDTKSDCTHIKFEADGTNQNCGYQWGWGGSMDWEGPSAGTKGVLAGISGGCKDVYIGQNPLGGTLNICAFHCRFVILSTYFRVLKKKHKKVGLRINTL